MRVLNSVLLLGDICVTYKIPSEPPPEWGERSGTPVPV